MPDLPQPPCRVVGVDVGHSAAAVAVDLWEEPISHGPVTGVVVGLVEAKAWSRWSNAKVKDFLCRQDMATDSQLIVAVEKAFTERRQSKRHLRDVGRAQGRRGGIVIGMCEVLGLPYLEVDPVKGDNAAWAWRLLGSPKPSNVKNPEHVRDACGIVVRFLGDHIDGRALRFPRGWSSPSQIRQEERRLRSARRSGTRMG